MARPRIAGIRGRAVVGKDFSLVAVPPRVAACCGAGGRWSEASRASASPAGTVALPAAGASIASEALHACLAVAHEVEFVDEVHHHVRVYGVCP